MTKTPWAFYDQNEPEDVLTPRKLQDMMLQVEAMLKPFDDHAGFRHRDLHHARMNVRTQDYLRRSSHNLGVTMFSTLSPFGVPIWIDNDYADGIIRFEDKDDCLLREFHIRELAK